MKTSSFCLVKAADGIKPLAPPAGASQVSHAVLLLFLLSPPPPPPSDESQYQSEYEEEQLEGALSDMELTNHCGEHTGEEEETCDTVGRAVLIG